MVLKGHLDKWLDRRLGGGKTPNLPSRLIGCDRCKKIWNVNDLRSACRHQQMLMDENWTNYFKSLLS